MERHMTTDARDGKLASRIVTTSGRHAAPVDAAGPAAAAFAGHILGKYFVVPSFRRGPALLLRMLQPSGREVDSGANKGAAKVAAVTTSTPAGTSAQPVVPIATAVNRLPSGPLPQQSVAQRTDVSRPAPVFAQRLLVQRKPMVNATGETVVVARALVPPRASNIALAQRPATAATMPATERGQTAAHTVKPIPASQEGVLRRPGNGALEVTAQPSAIIGRNVSPHSVLWAQLPAIVARESVPLTRSKMSTASAAESPISPVSRLGQPRLTMSSRLRTLVQRKSTIGPAIVQRPATAATMPATERGQTAAHTVKPIPASQEGVLRRPGNGALEVTAQPSAIIGRNVSPHSVLWAQLPAIVARESVPLTRSKMSTASAAESPISPVSRLGQPRLTMSSRLRTLVQRKSTIGRSANAVMGASGFTARLMGNGTRQFAPTMSPGTFEYSRSPLFPDNQAIHAHWRPIQAPVTHRQTLDFPILAKVAPSHNVDDNLLATTITHRTASPVPQPAAELAFRSSITNVNPVPTVVAATLGAIAPTPPPQPTNKSSESNQASSMPVEILADQIFRILERRLVVERERRGIR